MRQTAIVRLTDYIEERRERAVEVRETYSCEYVGAQSWVVTHPTEPERSYLVDMVERSCTCEDFRLQSNDPKLDCKHLVAIGPTWAQMFGEDYVPTERVADRSIDADYSEIDPDWAVEVSFDGTRAFFGALSIPITQLEGYSQRIDERGRFKPEETIVFPDADDPFRLD